MAVAPAQRVEAVEEEVRVNLRLQGAQLRLGQAYHDLALVAREPLPRRGQRSGPHFLL
jgi:hypothetical protein